MSKIIEWTDEQKKAWSDWVSGRPESVRALCEKLPPDRLYLHKPTNQRVTLYSYNEDGTITMMVTGEYNLVTFDRQVFGVNPDELVECDLPPEDEPLGTMLTSKDEIDSLIDFMKQGKPPMEPS